jgi:hypothetical protein
VAGGAAIAPWAGSRRPRRCPFGRAGLGRPAGFRWSEGLVASAGHCRRAAERPWPARPNGQRRGGESAHRIVRPSAGARGPSGSSTRSSAELDAPAAPEINRGVGESPPALLAKISGFWDRGLFKLDGSSPTRNRGPSVFDCSAHSSWSTSAFKLAVEQLGRRLPDAAQVIAIGRRARGEDPARPGEPCCEIVGIGEH